MLLRTPLCVNVAECVAYNGHICTLGTAGRRWSALRNAVRNAAGAHNAMAVRVDAAREELLGQGKAVMVASLSILYWGPSLHREPESKGDAIAACEVLLCKYMTVQASVAFEQSRPQIKAPVRALRVSSSLPGKTEVSAAMIC